MTAGPSKADCGLAIGKIITSTYVTINKGSSEAKHLIEGSVAAIALSYKGQVKRLAGSAAQGRAKFVETLFGIAA
jgi:hypothetical protein